MKRILTIGTSLPIAALAGLTIYYIHKRNQLATFAFVLMTLLGYGLYGISKDMAASEAMRISELALSVAFFAIDLGLVAYMLLGKEVKTQLKNKQNCPDSRHLAVLNNSVQGVLELP